MSSHLIPIAGPWITEKEIAAVTEAVSTNWYQQANESIKKFEQAFAIYTQRNYAIALPSCTSAIHLSLAAHGISEGDEVIVPNATWIASTAPIDYVGAKPIFVDVDPSTWCIDTKQVQAVITPNTKAILAVDLYGNMPDWDALQNIAEKHRLILIEDAAEAIGSQFHQNPAGSFGNASVFSFHGSKTLTTGEGGMLVTNDEDFYQRCLVLRDHGRKPGDTEFFNQQIAYKYKMTSLQAALGLAQLDRIDELVAKKRQIFSWYKKGLDELTDIRLNNEPENTFNSYWMVTLLIGEKYKIDSKTLRAKLKAKGVDTRPFFHPLTSIPAYQGQYTQEVNTPHAFDLAKRGLNLPSALLITQSQVEKVCLAIKSCLSTEN